MGLPQEPVSGALHHLPGHACVFVPGNERGQWASPQEGLSSPLVILAYLQVDL